MKLSDDSILEIYKSPDSCEAIASKFKIHKDTVRRIKSGKTHKNLTAGEGKPINKPKKFGYTDAAYNRYVATKKANPTSKVVDVYATLWGGMFAWKADEVPPPKHPRGGY